MAGMMTHAPRGREPPTARAAAAASLGSLAALPDLGAPFRRGASNLDGQFDLSVPVKTLKALLERVTEWALSPTCNPRQAGVLPVPASAGEPDARSERSADQAARGEPAVRLGALRS